MQVPIYFSFKEFEANYQTDLEKWQRAYIDGEEIDFLEEALKKYSPFKEIGVFTAERGSGKVEGIDIYKFVELIQKRVEWYIKNYYKQKEDKNLIDISIFNNSMYNGNLVWNNYYYDYKEQYYDGYKLDYREYLKIRYFISIKNNVDDWSILGYEFIFDEVGYKNFKLAVPKILKFIQERITQINRGETPPPQPITLQPTEQAVAEVVMSDLEPSQKEKIGLFIRSGFVDYLRQNNPSISTNQIAGFIDLLTAEHLKRTTINPYLSESNSKYAIQNHQDKKDLDFILNKFGITPKSE